MSPIAAFVTLIAALAIAWAVQFELRRRAALDAYWARGCAGRNWRRSFPGVPADTIREFLSYVSESFGFEEQRALNLAPNDLVIGLYRAHYPDESAPDALELETLHLLLGKRYGESRFAALPENVTFGELLSRAVDARPNTSLESGREK